MHDIKRAPVLGAPVVYIDDPPDAFNVQLSAAYRRCAPEYPKRERFSAAFWVMVCRVLVVLALIFVITWHIRTGEHPMSNPTPPPESPAPAAQPAPKEHPLKAAIQRFAKATIDVATHPDNGMFFFDAQELTVNEKLQQLKMQALIDSLCAAGVIDRQRYENRLEELVSNATQKLEEGAKAIAFSAMVNRKPINGSGQ